MIKLIVFVYIFVVKIVKMLHTVKKRKYTKQKILKQESLYIFFSCISKVWTLWMFKSRSQRGKECRAAMSLMIRRMTSKPREREWRGSPKHWGHSVYPKAPKITSRGLMAALHPLPLSTRGLSLALRSLTISPGKDRIQIWRNSSPGRNILLTSNKSKLEKIVLLFI